MKVAYTKAFLKRFDRCESSLQESIIEKIEEFRERKNHKQLKVHKLKGRLSTFYSFSVDYKTRIVFQYLSKEEVALLSVGDHVIYE
ncbi:type II toxin-antitoxin system mRNA interferase toxin, RelE/StbE family [Candidatus Azambacteria bacterium]|nr:type II toxin-antitoxin system mRNA interferase toxin, RelE/StbE family [Candidatus Azambacteria bacterium]